MANLSHFVRDLSEVADALNEFTRDLNGFSKRSVILQATSLKLRITSLSRG
jgi:phage-related minor tail protein